MTRPPDPSRGAAGRGFTLVEMLAVCATLALATTLTLGAASSVRGAHERSAAAAAVKDALRRARTAARSEVFGSGGGARLAFGAALTIGPRDDAPAGTVPGSTNTRAGTGTLDAARVALPRGWTAALVRVGDGALREGPDATLVFDESGRSEDAAVVARSDRGDVALVETLGISGQTEVFLGETAVNALRAAGWPR